MAERLTRKIGYEYEKAKRETQLLEINNKLGRLEDILEKYGIESVEELDKRLQNLFELTCGRKNGKTIVRKIILFDKMKQDRDTWKRACELACEHISAVHIITNDDMFENRDNLSTYFYQQAKKEGNDE